MAILRGGCHCGRVQFEVEAPTDPVLSDCNCSVCRMTGYLHLIVARSAFTLIAGEECLATYQFNTNVAKHYFCTNCGIKSFYVPRSHPDGISVNARCLEPGSISPRSIEAFDGMNWEQSTLAREYRSENR